MKDRFFQESKNGTRGEKILGGYWLPSKIAMDAIL